MRWFTRSTLSAAITLALVCYQFLSCSPSYSREFSKAGQVFQDVQPGVVTIFTSTGHGSGFLVDDKGLIVTNSHVVKENTGNLRIRFGPNQVVAANILVNDREHDVAVLSVNLKNIHQYKILPLFMPKGEALTLVGEQVIAVGSPKDRIKLEKTMTTGTVAKFDDGMIFHDANIDHGNSGGPLFNFDGQVIGINTLLGPSSHVGANIAGAIPITLALKNIDEARSKLVGSEEPSAELLPDIPDLPFPVSQLLKQDPDCFKKRKPKDYSFDSKYFFITVVTPPRAQRLHDLVAVQDKVLEHRQKRAKKKHFEVSDDEYSYKNEKYYDDETAVVTVLVIPKPKLTTGSKVANTLGFMGAATATVATLGCAAPLMAIPFLVGNHEVKKDFLKMSLLTEDNKPVGEPIETGRLPFVRNVAVSTGYSGSRDWKWIDKSYVGKYTFDAHCFDTDKKLKLVIGTEGDEKDRAVAFPNKLKNIIVEDFQPYWGYVAQQNGQFDSQNHGLAVKGQVKEYEM